MSLNAVVAGCNQKSNRAPVMQLEPDQVEESLDRLRQFGAVGLVEGSGRVQKYRHYLYEWLDVSKVGLSVMIELLVRGPQTEGELRGRVSRMDPIDDLNALRVLLTALGNKGLVIPLTPEGRGQVFTHALFPERDLAHQRSQYSQQSAGPLPIQDEDHFEPARPTVVRPSAGPTAVGGAPVAARSEDPDLLREAVAELRSQVKQQEQEIEELTGEVRRIADEFQDLKRALGS